MGIVIGENTDVNNSDTKEEVIRTVSNIKSGIAVGGMGDKAGDGGGRHWGSPGGHACASTLCSHTRIECITLWIYSGNHLAPLVLRFPQGRFSCPDQLVVASVKLGALSGRE